MISKLLLLVSLSLGSLQAVYGSGCHGASGFRLAPAHPTTTKAATKGASSTKSAATVAQIVFANPVEQDAYCESEYGEGSKVLDLAQMKEEFKSKPDDLQHALTPLFEEDPKALYVVAGHGQKLEYAPKENQKLVLALKQEGYPNDLGGSGSMISRVAGPVYVETRDAGFLQDEQETVHTSVLCFIPKPKYDPEAMKNSGDSMSGMSMTMSESSSTNQTSSSSWGVSSSLFGLITLAALCVAAVQTWKARQASNNSNAWMQQAPSLDLGGSYSVLSSDGDHRNSLLSSSSSNNVEMP